MTKFETLQQLDLDKVKNTNLRTAIQEILEDYKQTTDKEFYLKEYKEVIESFHALIIEHESEAIGDGPKITPPKKDKSSSTAPAKDKKVAGKPKQLTKAEEEALEKELARLNAKARECDEKMRKRNSIKKQLRGPRPKKTRPTLLKERTLHLLKLTPPELADDPEVQKGNREIADTIIEKCMSNWKMKRVKEAQSSVGKELDKIEEKSERSARRETATKWRNSLQTLDGIMPKVSKDKEVLKSFAKELKDTLKDVIKLYEDDPEKAVEVLKEKYTKDQLVLYIPEFVRTELKLVA